MFRKSVRIFTETLRFAKVNHAYDASPFCVCVIERGEGEGR